MSNVYNTLLERGFIEQATHEDEIKEMLSKEKISFYIGFDPTADSLHIGHFLTVMAMSHMQKAGHTPIALVGGGTGMVGDPTFKSEMRRVMTREEVMHNVDCFKKQLSSFINFEDEKAIMVNNGDWLLDLKYVDFIREYGIHFSVNKMLTADAYKTRLEKGLSFFEFNYMLMQSYDFLELNRKYDCKMQFGGSDQWSNIIGGVDLIRRVEGKNVYGLTLTLLTTSDNKKMGKTESGAVWLDPKKTTPYEFFQYFRNVGDEDVEKCLRLLTYLEMDYIKELNKLEGKEKNKAKEILAYEVTKIVHGELEANKAKDATKALFENGVISGSIPTTEINLNQLNECNKIIDILELTKLAPSKSEGRRLINQGGIKVNNVKIDSIEFIIEEKDFKECILLIQKGKKIFHHLKLTK
jgi:tyrosyl-tRNA synthetase